MNNWKTILTFTYPHEAHMAKGYLESEGVEAIIQDEMTAQVNNFYSNAIGGVKVIVRESNYDQGLGILQKGGYINENNGKVKSKIEIVSIDSSIDRHHCPFCKSDNIGKNRGLKVITIIVYMILGALFPIFKVNYQCYNCGKEWKYRRE